MEKTSLARGADYEKRVIYQPEFAKETRYYAMTGFLERKFMYYVNCMIDLLHRKGKKLFLLSLTPELMRTLILQVFVNAYLIYKITIGELTIGDFTALFVATMQFSYQLTEFGEKINGLYENALYIENFNVIMNYDSEMEAHMGEKEVGSLEVLEFRDVKFSYFGEKKKY